MRPLCSRINLRQGIINTKLKLVVNNRMRFIGRKMTLKKLCCAVIIMLLLVDKVNGKEEKCVESLSINCKIVVSWKTGFVIDVEVTPQETTNDWEVVVTFPHSIGKNAQIVAGSTQTKFADDDRTILSATSKRNLVKDEIFSFAVVFNNLKFGIPLFSQVPANFYLHKNANRTCHNLPETTTAEPETTTPADPTTVDPATTAAASKCEHLRPPEGYTVTNHGWREHKTTWKFIGTIHKNPDSRGVIQKWTIKIVFDPPVTDVDAYNFKAARMFHEGRVWFFTAQTWNTEPLDFHLRFMGTVPNADDAPTGVAYLCRGDEIPTQDITQPEFDFILSHDKAHKCPEFDPLSQCGPETVHSCLPAVSGRTRVKFISSEDETKYDYNEVIHKSILFYEAQRSGKLPAGNRIPWRGDSGLKDGCDVGHDLTGGWYDAGDDVKFGFPMAYSATVLAWGMIEFQEAYIDAGEWQNALDMLKWATDYFIKAHTSPNVLYVQIGDPVRDHSKWWRPEDFLVDRKSYKIDIRHPGTEVAAETAAALAAASIVFRDVNSSYADTLVQHSKELYRFADRRRKTYHESVQSVRNFYKSWNGYNDELLWAAVWLHKATNESSFLKKAEDRYDAYGANEVPQEFSWDDKYAGVQVLLAQETGHIKYRDAVKAFVDLAINTRKTPHGLTWLIKWGSNRYAANFALIALMASKIEPELPERHSYVRYARKQIHCMLGSGDGRRSYVVGFGHNPPKHVHHRASSCPQWRQRPVSQCTFESFRNPAPNPHVLYGALVGGPNLDGEYTDVRDDYVRNEVAVDYNAGFQSAVAGLKYFYKHPTNE